MLTAVELYFDPPGEISIEFLWYNLAQAGISNSMLENCSRPHLALAVFEGVQPEEIPLADFAAETTPFKVELANLGVFPDHGLLFAAPVVTQQLLAVHHRLFQMVGRGKGCAYYLPGAWIPQITLALDLDDEGLAQAIKLLRQDFKPQTLTITGVSLVRYTPQAEVICDYPLNSGYVLPRERILILE